MTAFRSVLFLLAFLGASLPASGHDTLPREWCSDPNLTPVIVGEFAFEELELRKYNDELPADRCGIVDAYHGATHISHEHCAKLGGLEHRSESERSGEKEQLPGIEFGDWPMPIVLEPEIYNDARKHHAKYRFEDGLSGVCVICVPIEE
jgi:hypothetical protein